MALSGYGKPSRPAPLRPVRVHMVRTAKEIHVQLSADGGSEGEHPDGRELRIFTITINQSYWHSAAAAVACAGSFAFASAVLMVLVIIRRPRC